MIEREATPFADGFLFPEAPKWQRDRLWVSDVFAREVHALSADGARLRTVPVPNRPSGIGILSDGSPIVVSAIDRTLLRIGPDGTSPYADLSPHVPTWLNDFAVDPQDRLFVGAFGYDLVAGEVARPAQLHRVDPDGTISAVADGLEFPNGAVVINQGRTLVVAETWVGRITAFDIRPDGTLANRRLFADLHPRQPDGLCADAAGAIWVGIYNTGEMLRVTEGGAITDRLRFEGSAISCVLGGRSGRTLFMTTFLGTEADMKNEARRGVVFATEVDVPGPDAGADGAHGAMPEQAG